MNASLLSFALAMVAVVIFGCEEKEAETSKSNATTALETAQNAAEPEAAGVCGEYRTTVEEICVASFRDGLDIPCHRIVTRANVALASDDEVLCEQHMSDLKAERKKKASTMEPVEFGEACAAYLDAIRNKCLSRLGKDYPAQCGGAMVTVGELGSEAEPKCKAMATMLSRI